MTAKDVYKRQGQRRLASRVPRADNDEVEHDLPSSLQKCLGLAQIFLQAEVAVAHLRAVGQAHVADMPAPVSYTHLDVYKRQRWGPRLARGGLRGGVQTWRSFHSRADGRVPPGGRSAARTSGEKK